jgi:NitT/TauT family transport system permease protein
LFPNLSTTFLELFLGIALACLAIPLGLAMGRSKTLEYSLDPIVSAFNAMPRIAFMPLLILVFGLGLMSKVILVLVGCFFPILVNVFHGMKNVDPLMIDMARVFGAKRIFMAREVFLPSILPFLIAGFRIAFALGLIMVVVGEFLAGNLGVGYMIATEAGYYHASAVMAWVLIIAAISIFLTELIRYYENRMKYWK